ncbi:hypothetical protein [Streptomyces sp. NPDC048845]|uniref:hypothetical protein n=1 Tax=Streptomyces sp. NPDC048845 TaxID=3155390 RepID=UPI0034260308
MNTESNPEGGVPLWLPATGYQLRKAGIHFDAVRVSGALGRELADRLATLTNGDPGPIVEQANGDSPVYFLVPPGSTSRRPWPTVAQRLTANALHGDCYVGIPALQGHTWPLSWRYEPTAPNRLVHPLLLYVTLCIMTGRFVAVRDSLAREWAE